MRCYCGVRDEDPENSEYVVNGTPCCTPLCWQSALSEELRTSNRVTHVHTQAHLPLGDRHAWDVV